MTYNFLKSIIIVIKNGSRAVKKKIKFYVNNQKTEKEINYIPVRYILAIMLTVFEIATIIGIVIFLCFRVPFFYVAAALTQFACVIKIVASDDNPDYKIPWLLFVLILPVAGFMLYFMFYSRKLKKKYVKRLKEIKDRSYRKNDKELFEKLKSESTGAYNQAKMLCNIAETHLFTNTKQTYFSSGEEMFSGMLKDLKRAEKFIYLEYFIIEEGIFWNSILEILKEKAANGLEVRIIYDDVGCMSTLPGNYSRILEKWGIEATPFSRLKGDADSEFNNRSHRKLMIIDGYIGYTGGVNLADEYINKIKKYGHWKDTGIRLEGEAVNELTKLFWVDFGINVKTVKKIKHNQFPGISVQEEKGYVVPFGDGPRPIFKRRVGKSVIQNMVNSSTKYMYMMSPYLIIDNDLCQDIENAALRGVDVKIIVPHIPDKKLVFAMTKSFYPRLMEAGVKIYEYKPGFVHAKNYICDGEYAMTGTINLDYRSLVHHFENGIWMYKCSSFSDMKKDMDETVKKSIRITPDMIKTTLWQRFIRSLIRIFAPLL